jgi:TIR domain
LSGWRLVSFGTRVFCPKRTLPKTLGRDAPYSISSRGFEVSRVGKTQDRAVAPCIRYIYLILVGQRFRSDRLLRNVMAQDNPGTDRDILFISKATPGDDDFVLWLAPRLEAAGYKVFADILTLEPGDRWRKQLTATLRDRSAKMLLCCRDSTLAKEGVLGEIELALDVAKTLGDPKFVIPLRLEPYKKIYGIAELQHVDFVRGWAEGLSNLLGALKRQKVPRSQIAQINPNWEVYRRRNAVPMKEEPERLSSNWLRIAEAPDVIRYFEATGAVDRFAIKRACEKSHYPAEPNGFGFFAFGTLEEINKSLALVAKFSVKHEIPLLQFKDDGLETLGIRAQDASNMIHSMFRQAWNNFCRQRRLLEYRYSNATGFHVSKDQAKIGQRIYWGNQAERRWSMLRNAAGRHVWQYGVTGQPAFWPFPHFKFKSRVLFAPLDGTEAGEPFDEPKKQHRLRRTVCKGWRNKQWYGRMLAFIELLAGETAFIQLPLSDDAFIKLDAAPLLFMSPVSTQLPDILEDDQEEEDVTTLGRPEPHEEEES